MASIAANATAAAHGASTALLLDLVAALDMVALELKLLAGALGIIYLGAHAALRRPPSASPARGKKSKKNGDDDNDDDDDDDDDDEEDDDDDDDDDDAFSQGLEPSDAIMFPILAGTILIGLYYLIQWLQDPTLLNKVLRWYMSTMAMASLLTLYAHGIELAASLVFPRYWRGRDGSLRKVDQRARTVTLCDDAGRPMLETISTRSAPLPLGPLGSLARFESFRTAAWALRRLLTRRWIARIFVRGLGEEKATLRFAHLLALLLALATALAYHATHSPLLSNLLGYGMCYGSFLLLTPTDFLTSSLVLSGLFVYDVVMVFYTPYMVTVATKLDVPIKLTFEAAERKSILGLGDIVIPGMVIAWALRFDLWRHYLAKVKYELAELNLVHKDADTGEMVTTKEKKHMEIKTPYVEAKGRWGDWLWARGPWVLSGPGQFPPEVAASSFGKPYFYASLAGYSLGMMATLTMLLVFERGQPALLYLVPGVLGSLVLTAAARGEPKKIWAYSEDGSIDTEDVVVDLDGDGKVIKTLGWLEDGVVDTTKTTKKKKTAEEAEEEKKKEREKKKEDRRRRRMRRGSSQKTSPTGEKTDEADEDKDGLGPWMGAERRTKRRRILLLSVEAAAERGSR